MTDAATMKIVANDVRPEATPSIGTGKASAIVEAAKRANTPSSIRPLGPEAAKLQPAATVAAAPASPTEATTGRTRRSSSETPALTRRFTGVEVNASGPGGLSTCCGVIASVSRCRRFPRNRVPLPRSLLQTFARGDGNVKPKLPAPGVSERSGTVVLRGVSAIATFPQPTVFAVQRKFFAASAFISGRGGCRPGSRGADADEGR